MQQGGATIIGEGLWARMSDVLRCAQLSGCLLAKDAGPPSCGAGSLYLLTGRVACTAWERLCRLVASCSEAAVTCIQCAVGAASLLWAVSAVCMVLLGVHDLLARVFAEMAGLSRRVSASLVLLCRRVGGRVRCYCSKFVTFTCKHPAKQSPWRKSTARKVAGALCAYLIFGGPIGFFFVSGVARHFLEPSQHERDAGRGGEQFAVSVDANGDETTITQSTKNNEVFPPVLDEENSVPASSGGSAAANLFLEEATSAAPGAVLAPAVPGSNAAASNNAEGGPPAVHEQFRQDEEQVQTEINQQNEKKWSPFRVNPVLNAYWEAFRKDGVREACNARRPYLNNPNLSDPEGDTSKLQCMKELVPWVVENTGPSSTPSSRHTNVGEFVTALSQALRSATRESTARTTDEGAATRITGESAAGAPSGEQALHGCHDLIEQKKQEALRKEESNASWFSVSSWWRTLQRTVWTDYVFKRDVVIPLLGDVLGECKPSPAPKAQDILEEGLLNQLIGGHLPLHDLAQFGMVSGGTHTTSRRLLNADPELTRDGKKRGKAFPRDIAVLKNAVKLWTRVAQDEHLQQQRQQKRDEVVEKYGEPNTWNVAAALQAGPPETFQFREFCERTPGDAELYKWSTCFMEEFKVTNWRVTGVKSFESMFEGTAGMSFPLFWDVSKARDMKGMFSKSDLNQDLSTWGWDVSAVMNMDEMFENADAFTGQGLSTWTVSRVTSMSRMFQEAAMFNGDLSTWDVRAVTAMDRMFSGASVFNQPIGAWKVSAVTNMRGMFEEAIAFNQPIGDWDVRIVTDMEGMFYDASAFNQPIDAWKEKVSAVTNMAHMFGGAIAFNQPIDAWKVSAVTNMRGMFAFAEAFNQPIGAWDVRAVTNMEKMFFHAEAFNQPIGAWEEKVGAVTNMARMFDGAIAFNQPIDAWKVSAVTNMQFMFKGAIAFNQPIGAWDVSAVTSMRGMFLHAIAFNQPIAAWGEKLGPNGARGQGDVDVSEMLFGAKSFDQNMQGFESLIKRQRERVGTYENMLGQATSFNWRKNWSGAFFDSLTEEMRTRLGFRSD